MDKPAGITLIKAVEMLDVDDIVLITVSNDTKETTEAKKLPNEFASILAEKQNLIELGYHHVQVLREEINAVRTELQHVRHAAKVDLEAARNAAMVELQKQKYAAQVELESVRSAAQTTLVEVWTEMKQLQSKIAYYEGQEIADMIL